MIGMRQKRFNFIARIFNRNDNTSVTIIAPIVQACREMSAHKTGALIVIGRQSDLRLITEGGIAIDAKISTPLLENIFFKNAPLHDAPSSSKATASSQPNASSRNRRATFPNPYR